MRRTNINQKDCLLVVYTDYGADNDPEIDLNALFPDQYLFLLIGIHMHFTDSNTTTATGLILRELESSDGHDFERVGYARGTAFDTDWLSQWEQRSLKIY